MSNVNDRYKNLYWLINEDNIYELHSTYFNEDQIVLNFTIDENDLENYIYSSELLQVENEDIFAFSIDKAMEQFENIYIDYIQEKIFYYEDILKEFI